MALALGELAVVSGNLDQSVKEVIDGPPWIKVLLCMGTGRVGHSEPKRRVAKEPINCLDKPSRVVDR